MNKIVWENLSNTEIRIKMKSMEMEYEAVKNKINTLLNTLDELDNEYNKANKEINKRMKNE
jgi:hypothetical protein